MTEFPVSFLRYASFLLTSLPQLAALPPAKGGRHRVLDTALDAVADRPGLGLEFGVWKGTSLRHAARRQPSRAFHGFDSLRGFPEDGRRDWRMDFSLSAAPRLPRNCTFHAGWFEDTVPPFVARLDAPVALVNLDCDIHSSAWTVLDALAPHLQPGVAIHLDEALNYDTWLWNEMLALFQMLEATGLGVTWVGRGGRVRGLPETLAMLEAGRYPKWRDDVEAGYARQAACVLTARCEAPPPAEAEAFAERLAARHAAHLAGTQVRQDCHPDDPAAPPPPRKPAWRRWLRL
ncbi:class I SAM-dependent methyltransferase [Falsiroseomonas sp. E2-1-a4]|uniref:class I SAM-dependent methyltransferase n=1 Tax=Falsiroseomonas sp. E2-1-a4 TaxID=3239299 RepID=UPI003F2E2373